jgi:thioredoxin reductase (NADPH)
LAPGLYRRPLGVPGEESLIGAGVHTCASCEGPIYAGEDVVVVGAANSGVEQALYLVPFAKSVTIVDASAGPRCSLELYQMAKAHPGITFKQNRRVRGFKGGRTLRAVLVQDAKTGEIEELPAAGAFITIGREPATTAFQTSVDVDQDGFIKTNRGMQTNLPGVFAAGHARSRHVRGPEEAAGEGYKAAMQVLRYLNNSTT